MENKIIKHKAFIGVTLFLFLNLSVLTLSVHATDPSASWTSQATGCYAYPGNINNQLLYVYLGTSVPSSISSQYPNATANLLPAFKTALVGMKQYQLKSFVIPDGYGSNAPPAPTGAPSLANKDLYFDVTLDQILVGADSSGATTSSSLVNIHYTLYIDCVVSGASSTQANSVSPAPDNTNIIVFGLILGLGAIAGIGYVVYTVRKPKLSTEKILEKTKQKETKNIQSLKESLGTSPTETIQKKTTSKRPPSVRRRK